MEEILASIRRIISEDDAPAADAPAEVEEPVAEAPAPAPLVIAEDEPEDDDDDALELTERVESLVIVHNELYESEVDALRAQHRAAAEATLNRQVQAMKRSWASELGTAARSRAARFGSVWVPLSSLPIVCCHPLVEQAIDM